MHNSATTHGLVEFGMFSEKEYRRFRRAEKFLWTVRCIMHFLTGRPEERLSFDIQREIAAILGYNKHGGSVWRRTLYEALFSGSQRGWAILTLIACAKLESEHVKKASGFDRLINKVVGSNTGNQGDKRFCF